MSESQMGTMLESRDREPLSHSLEDYLEAIVDLAGGPNEPIRAVDVATKLNVSKASVSKAVTNLKKKATLFSLITVTSRLLKRATNTVPRFGVATICCSAS